MKKILTLAIISLLLISAFSILATQVKAEISPLAGKRVYWEDYHDTNDDSIYGNYKVFADALFAKGCIIDEISTAPISYATLQNYDILVLNDPETELLDSEITAIKSWLALGVKGVWVIGEWEYAFHQPSVNKFSAEYGVQYTGEYMDWPTITTFVTHPITKDISKISDSAWGVLSVTLPSVGLAWATGGQCVLAVYDDGIKRIVWITNSDTFWNYLVVGDDNLRLGINIMEWLALTPKAQEMDIPVKGEITNPWNAFRGYYWTWDYRIDDYRLYTTVFKPILPQYPKGFHEFLEDGEVIKKGEKISYKRYIVYHEGIDIFRESGTPVYSAASGEIKYIDNVYVPPKKGEPERDPAGKWIMIWHGDVIKLNGALEKKISTRHLHLDDISDYIKGKLEEDGKDPKNFVGSVNIKIPRGTMIGTVGNTGCTDQPTHLHFEVRQGDDLTYLPYNTLPLNPCEFVAYGGYTTPPEKPKSFGIKALCPVDLIVTDPDGLIICKEINQLPTLAQYIEVKHGIDGEEPTEIPHDIVIIRERKIGEYSITVIPQPGTEPTDTYNLQVISDGVTLILAENVPISNIPAQPYVLRCTETEMIPIIPATIDFDPDTLNLKSKGQWVTVYIELPVGHGYNVSMIDLASLMLNGKIQAETKPIKIGDYDGNEIPDLMVKFNRTAVQNILNIGDEVEIAISGKLIDGRQFEGKDTIKVIRPP